MSERNGSERKGEGSYEGAEKFQREQHAFAASGKVAPAAREAADALDAEEAAELIEAEAKAAHRRAS